MRLALDKVRVADRWGLPVVVTDCRYPNEAAALRAAGALLVRVDRPSLAVHQDQGAEHISETALAGYRPDAVLTNSGSVAELHRAVTASRFRAESSVTGWREHQHRRDAP
ncbi:hypothetical protein ACFVJM_26435 [Streptomyces virginiae]|uniref:deoxynucleotide monophosphate kinase family protein n=1 Tax=Streptomyces virginiae TaxID=1961 RepID=UPI003643F4A3